MSHWCRRIFISESLCDLSIGAKRQQLMPSKLNTQKKHRRKPYSCNNGLPQSQWHQMCIGLESNAWQLVCRLRTVVCCAYVRHFWSAFTSLQKQTLIKSLKYCEFEKIYGRMSNDTLDRLAVKNKEARITVEKANRKRIELSMQANEKAGGREREKGIKTIKIYPRTKNTFEIVFACCTKGSKKVNLL